MSVQIYDIPDDDGGPMIPDSNGDWVALDDYKRLVDEIERLTARRAMSDLLCRCADEVRCDMRAEIERLTADNERLRVRFRLVNELVEEKVKRIAELEARHAKFLLKSWGNNQYGNLKAEIERLTARVVELEAVLEESCKCGEFGHIERCPACKVLAAQEKDDE